MIKQKCYKIQIDRLIMSEVNTKQTSQNRERIKEKLALLNRNIELIVANSNDYDLTDSEWLPSGILNVFWRLIVLIIDWKKIEVDKIRKQTACQFTDGKKKIILIRIYRIPQSSQEGVYNTLTQYNRMDRKVKNAKQYRHKIFSQIINFLNENEHINDVMIVENLN